MRIAALVLFLIPGVGFADSFSPASKITNVTVYPDSAAITRKAPFSIPAGQHTLILRDLPALDDTLSLRIQVDGAQQGAVVYRQDYVPPAGLPKPPEVKAAEDQIKDVELRIQAVKDDAHRARLTAQAAATRLGFLQQLGQGDDMASAGLDTLRTLSQMIGTEALDAHQAALTAEIEARKIERALEDLQEELAEAHQALDAVSQQDEDRIFVSIEVTSDTAATGAVILSYLAEYGTQWAPIYDLHLTQGSDPSVQIQRDVLIYQETGENWVDVNLTLSTLEPFGQIEPSWVYGDRKRIQDPLPLEEDAGRYKSLAEPIVEAPVILEESQGSFSVSHNGPGVTYAYPTPVSIASGADAMRLKLGSLTMPAVVMAEANPSRDDTAFLMAEVTNDTGEEFLAANIGLLHLDGAFIGRTEISAIAAGAKARLAFGPIDDLRLQKVWLTAGEGETGLISRYNQQRQHWRLEVENLSAKAWDLRVLDGVPYSEQDDLQISWTATRQPDETNVDDRPGVLGWDLSLAAGETQTIDIRTEITWPEGKELR